MSTVQTANIHFDSGGNSRIRVGAAGNIRFDSFGTDSGIIAQSNNMNIANIGGGHLGAFRNKIINGNFQFWQWYPSRMFTATSVWNFFADRWLLQLNSESNVNSLITLSSKSAHDLPIDPSTRALRYNQTGIIQNNRFINIDNIIERASTLANKIATISFWVYNEKSDPQPIQVGWVQRFGGYTDASPSTTTVFGDIEVPYTGSWQKITLTAKIPSVYGKRISTNTFDYAYLYFKVPNRVQTFNITNVQIEEGNIATPFERRDLALEFRMCQRYLQVYDQPPLKGVVQIVASPTRVQRMGMMLPVRMARTPWSYLEGSLPVWDGTTSGVTISSITDDFSTPWCVEYHMSTSAAMGTNGGRLATIYQAGTTGSSRLILDAQY